MRRRWMHASFAAAALAFASLAAVEGWRLQESRRVNDAIAGKAPVGRDVALPEARFVWAADQARRGNYDSALKEYKALSREKHEYLAASAMFNAGNLQLRQALQGGPDAVARALPLVELAKQSYRATLRVAPQSWDARYNLERALWLAPELETAPTDRIRRDVEERVMSTLQNTRAELP